MPAWASQSAPSSPIGTLSCADSNCVQQLHLRASRWTPAFSTTIGLRSTTYVQVRMVRVGGGFDTLRMAIPVLPPVLIAAGALLPGTGGSCRRFGHTEVLCVTERLGIILTYLGLRRATRGVDARRAATGGVSYAIAR